MPFAFDCDRCGKPLDKPGALLFGPPGLFPARTVEKLHICVDCWPEVRSAVTGFVAGENRARV